MKNKTYPLALPVDLERELRKCARLTGLSVADTMRQSMKLGLPKLKENLAKGSLRPFTEEESRLAFAVPNSEFDDLERYCASLQKRLPEE